MNRRAFLRNGIWLLSAPTVIISRLSIAQVGLVGAKRSGFTGGVTSASGATNNVALVGTNSGGSQVSGGAASKAFAMPSSVVNGNNVIFCVAALGAALTPTAGMLTKTAGTSTVGTIALDKALNASSGSTIALAIYRVPVTGSGSLTLTFNPASGTWAFLVAAAEFSGMNATPLDAGGSGTGNGTSSGSGLAQGETSGSVSSSNVGNIVYIASEGSINNWARLQSDTVIFNDSNGSTDMTGLCQFKIINASPNTLQSNVEATSISWWACWASYKSS